MLVIFIVIDGHDLGRSLALLESSEQMELVGKFGRPIGWFIEEQCIASPEEGRSCTWESIFDGLFASSLVVDRLREVWFPSLGVYLEAMPLLALPREVDFPILLPLVNDGSHQQSSIDQKLCFQVFLLIGIFIPRKLESNRSEE